MKRHEPVLTGPAAARIYQLDGFRDIDWPFRYVTAHTAHAQQEVIRCRRFTQQSIDGVAVADIATVCRHLNAKPSDLLKVPDGIAALDRVELATEHARRLGYKVEGVPGSIHPGDTLLRAVRKLSGTEPPTESYAETIALQLLRSWGFNPVRQLEVNLYGRVRRADFVLPFRKQTRPTTLRPQYGLIVEIDSEEFHKNNFNEDHVRSSEFDSAGFHRISLTPTQLYRNPNAALRAINGALSRATSPTRNAA